MKVLYAKTVLYLYPNIESVMEQIDELVEKKALSSMNDYSPCIEQCQKILEYSAQKMSLYALKKTCDGIFSKYSEEEMACLEYKFFKRKGKEELKNFDLESRTYFRRQIRLADKFAQSLEKKGVTDEYFEDRFLCMEFIAELLKRVKEQEKASRKNKSAAEKQALKMMKEQEKPDNSYGKSFAGTLNRRHANRKIG